jgi:hypothetical protein
VQILREIEEPLGTGYDDAGARHDPVDAGHGHDDRGGILEKDLRIERKRFSGAKFSVTRLDEFLPFGDIFIRNSHSYCILTH